MDQWNQEYWSETSHVANPTYRGHYQRQVAENEEEFVIEQLLPRQTRVLEVGPGNGRFTRHLSKLADFLTVCDISEPVLEQLQLRLPDTQAIQYEHRSMEDLEGQRNFGRFDAVVAMRVVPYVENWTAGLRTLKAAVKPGGLLLFDLWCEQSFEYRFSRRWMDAEPVPAHRLRSTEIREAIESLECTQRATYRWGYPHIGTWSSDFWGALLFPGSAYSTTFCLVVP